MDKRRNGERPRAVLVCTLALLTMLPLANLILSLLSEAAPIDWLTFLSRSPTDAGRSGGIAPLLLSTALILAVCLATVISFGTACALYLSESTRADGRFGRQVGRALDILAGVPSIVYGLFGYLFFAQLLGLGFSIVSGGLSLACMALPLYVRLAQQALQQVPPAYRDAAEALNLSHAGYVRRVLLPSAAPGLAAAVIVAAGRALAETAVLIFTAGYVTRAPESLLDSGRALSVHIYDLAMNVPGGQHAAAATALVLVVILISFNLGARKLAHHWQSPPP